jgi:hypothetical protein
MDLQPLLARDRYTDEEWGYASSGRCDWIVATYPSLKRCGEPSSPESLYRWCAVHDQEARDEDPSEYGC